MRKAGHIVLTGATRGLGEAMTAFFVSKDWVVSGCGTSREIVAACNSKYGAPHRFDDVDTSDDGQVKEWASEVLSSSGAPDFLINNAATMARNSPLWELGTPETDPVIDVNIKGVINTVRHFVPAMIRRGKGVIVNFSSGWGRSTSPEVAVYCATKWAIEGLTQALAEELPPGLAAIALNPGIIHTDMLASCFGSGAAHYPKPAQWVKSAGPYILKLGAKDNGGSLTVPNTLVD